MTVWRRMSTSSFSASSTAFRSGPTLKPMMIAFEAEASSTSLVGWRRRRRGGRCTFTFVVTSLPSASREHLDRALHVGLEDDRQLLDLALLDLAEELLERHPSRSSAPARGGALLLAELGDAARLRLVLHHLEGVAGARRSSWKPVTSTGVDGPASCDRARRRSSLIERTRPQVAPETKTSPDLQRAVLHQHGGHDAAADLLARLEHDALRRHLGVGLELAGCRR